MGLVLGELGWNLVHVWRTECYQLHRPQCWQGLGKLHRQQKSLGKLKTWILSHSKILPRGFIYPESETYRILAILNSKVQFYWLFSRRWYLFLRIYCFAKGIRVPKLELDQCYLFVRSCVTGSFLIAEILPWSVHERIRWCSFNFQLWILKFSIQKL